MFHPLDTPRLLIRPLLMDDLAEIYRILDVDLRFDDLTLERRREWLLWATMNDTQLARLYQPPYGEKAVTLKDSGRLIGLAGLVPSVIPAAQLPHFNPQPRPNALIRPEMGLFWALDPVYQGQGYATEAAQALIDFVFNELHFERVIATTETDNLHSQAVMRRLGMDIQRNPFPDPFWCEVVGVLENPGR